MNNAWFYFIGAIVVATLANILLSVAGANVSIDPNLSAEAMGGLMFALFVAALLIERFVDIILAHQRAPEKASISSRLRELDAAIDTAQTDRWNTSPLMAERVDTAQQLEQYRSETERQAMIIAFPIGVLVSLAGIRVLGEMVDATELSGAALVLFATVDAILTAGLLAGGSKGINKFSSAISNGLKPKDP